MVETKKYFTEEDMIMLDEEVRFVPLTYDKMFKGIFKERVDILKLFILSQLELDIEPEECRLELLDSELPKMNKDEYQKTVDLYVKINKIYVNVEINREYFNNISKRNLMYADRLYSMILDQGEMLDELDNRFFVQINLNAVDKLDIKKEKLKYGTDKLVTYGVNSGDVYNDNKLILVKYLEYYRDLYYNKNEKLNEIDLWMVLFTSRTFQELYNVSKKLFNEEMHCSFMKEVINMASNRRYFEEWEIQQLNDYVEYKARQNAINDGIERGLKRGLEQGIEKGIEKGIEQGIERGIEQGIEKTEIEYIKNMLNENIDIELISKITKKTKDEILKIKNS